MEYIPKKVAAKRAFLIWEKDLVDIYDLMSEIVAAIKMILQINKDNKQIRLDDLKNISAYNTNYEKIYYSSKQYINGVGLKSDIKKVFAFHLDFHENASRIQKRIARITSFPSVSNVKLDLLEIISELAASPFFVSCESFNKTMFLRQNYTIGEFDKHCYHFIEMYIKFGRYDFEKKTYEFRLLEREEIEKMNEIRAAFYESIRGEIPGDRCTFVFNEYEYKVRNGELI